jgi:hypothetical protein
MILPRVIFALLLASGTLLSAPENTVIHDPAAAQALEGDHRFSLQWISWENFGSVTITHEDGLLRIRGHQIREGTGEVSQARQAMTIDGVIAAIDQTTFEFEGEIMIRLGRGGEAEDPCLRKGKLTFKYREGNSRSWRLSQQQNPCVDHVDYVDIYVDRDWRPAISKPRPPTQAELWGIGMITKEPDPSAMPGIVLFPDSPIPLYEQPGGQPTAVVYKAADQWRLLIQEAGSQASAEASPDDLREVGYESGAVVVFEEKDGYVKVLPRSTDQSAWMKMDDLAQQEFNFLSWIDFLNGKSDGGLFPRESMALNLRQGPEATHPKVATLRGELIDITPTGQKNGLWLEVDVLRYDIHVCTDGQGHIAERWRGWLKAVDDAGFPNLWYHTRGC